MMADILLLHEHPELTEECAILLNIEWKRSPEARIHDLKKSCNELPCSFVLVSSSSSFHDGESSSSSSSKVIGHSRLHQTVEDPRGCLISSLVVSKEHRGKGFGKRLMRETEDYAKKRGFETAYLRTNKESFYSRLGYSLFCRRNGGGFAVGMTARGHESLSKFLPQCDQLNSTSKTGHVLPKITTSLAMKTSSIQPPVPPPPPPPPPSQGRDLKEEIWMKKTLQ